VFLRCLPPLVFSLVDLLALLFYLPTLAFQLFCSVLLRCLPTLLCRLPAPLFSVMHPLPLLFYPPALLFYHPQSLLSPSTFPTRY
jgi:hypothetical protein